MKGSGRPFLVASRGVAVLALTGVSLAVLTVLDSRLLPRLTQDSDGRFMAGVALWLAGAILLYSVNILVRRAAGWCRICFETNSRPKVRAAAGKFPVGGLSLPARVMIATLALIFAAGVIMSGVPQVVYHR